MLSKGQIKLIRSLQQKKQRKQHKLFVIEGVKLVNELVFSEYKIHSIFCIHNEKAKEYADMHFPMKYSSKIIYINSKELSSISALTTPNKFLAVAEIKENEALLNNCDIYLALEGIKDPGNLGTIIRIADWYNIKQIVCSEDCADIYNPKVVQASMGSIFRVQVNYCDIKEYVKNSSTTIYASVLDGEDFRKIDFKKPATILIGNESEGLSPGLKMLADHQISITRYGKAESLNAAVASGIILDQLRST